VRPPQPDRRLTLLASAGRGALIGLAGVAAMTAAELVEQAATGRPDSYVPGRTLLALTGRRVPESSRPTVANHAMHWGTGAALGALRGIWAVTGLRGPRATLAHTVVRLATDQTLENVAGTGAPPRTWPRREEVVDVAHKAVYSLVTGWLADRSIAPVLQSAAGRRSH
jgi:hypothetical protein